MSDYMYQIAEIFDSIQGEGYDAGMPQTFIRFAGCSVGRYLNSGEPGVATCTAFDGTTFSCDTDYRKTQTLSIDEIIEQIKYPAVCLTGGEPCDRDLSALINRLPATTHVHLETSGTVWRDWLLDCDWIVVSPKKDWKLSVLEEAHEIRFLYDVNFPEDSEQLMDAIAKAATAQTWVYVSPISYRSQLNQANIEATLALLDKHPGWRLSLQMHKVIGVR